jgi:hypothetical protein
VHISAYRTAEKAKKTAVAGTSKKGKEKEITAEKITLTIPGGQKKSQPPNLNQTPSSIPVAGSVPGDDRGDQVDSMVVEDDGAGGAGNDDIDEEEDEEDEGGHDMDVDDGDGNVKEEAGGKRDVTG